MQKVSIFFFLSTEILLTNEFISLSYFFREEWWDLQKSKEEGNTGFYFVRSNKRTIKLWADAFAAVPKYVSFGFVTFITFF